MIECINIHCQASLNVKMFPCAYCNLHKCMQYLHNRTSLLVSTVIVLAIDLIYMHLFDAMVYGYGFNMIILLANLSTLQMYV